MKKRYRLEDDRQVRQGRQEANKDMERGSNRKTGRQGKVQKRRDVYRQRQEGRQVERKIDSWR